MENIVFEYSIKPAWEVVQTIEKKIKKIFKPEDSELFNATIMTVSELIENAIKYGQALPSVKSIDFSFLVDENSIIIKVMNPIENKIHLDELIKHLQRIKESNDPQQLYTQRLQVLLANPHIRKSQLGLYRISHEGKYDLSYEYKDDILTVTAVRNIG